MGGAKLDSFNFSLFNNSPYGIDAELRIPNTFFNTFEFTKLTPTISAGNAYIYTYNSTSSSRTSNVQLTNGVQVDLTTYLGDGNDTIGLVVKGANALSTFVVE